MRLMKVVLAVSALFVLCNLSFGQADLRRPQDTDRGRLSTQQDQKKIYEQGLRDGQDDRKHNRDPHPRHNDRAYVDGYRAGYGQAAHDRDRHDQQNVDRQAHDRRFQEGLRDGQEDRKHKRVLRPRQNDRAYVDGYHAGYGQPAHGDRDQPQKLERR